jgi:predicted DNA-binding helix-hairpin-helix protein
MDSVDTLKLLASQMTFEADGEPSPSSPAPACFSPKACPELTERERGQAFVHSAQLPNGQKIKLLKTLLTSVCERYCFYCPFRAGRDFRRATFKPDEFASLFAKLSAANMAEGMFLSSGVTGGGVRTQDQILATAEILRKKYQYRGYIHLKIMPGAEKEQVYHAMQLADRVSINLEAPNTERLAKLAPHKIFMEELLQPLKWVEEFRSTVPAYKFWNGHAPSTVTQFVAGGSDESDLELLTATNWLNKNVHLKRAYFSAFHPIADTPFENKPATDPMREHRLYQASFLLRDYGFDLEDLLFTSASNLPLHADPKQAWAQMYLAEHPVEINKAEKRELIRIPGIGLKGADAILNARKINHLRDLSALKKLGIITERAAPYLLFDGRQSARQIELW